MPQNTTTTAVQEQILGSIRDSQEATVNACRSWAKTFTTVTPNLVEAFSTPKVDNYFGFAEKLFSFQRDFTMSMFEVGAELGKAGPETAKRATAAAENVRATAAK